ncbi:hypothetical protein NE237_028066 [Protea cynaroides]|uniref:Uncharacterized protein n=1 Tax=Protea cynaroides TaxID=273540 RepID=A0A9Q0GT26_9MAGN|nr:hypothetical protein NE237_028066 [Protea cynaroides]
MENYGELLSSCYILRFEVIDLCSQVRIYLSLGIASTLVIGISRPLLEGND